MLAMLVVGTMLASQPSLVTNAPIRLFTPALMRVLGELPAYNEAFMAAEGCARCHSEIVEQWKQSMHAIADTEPIYARVVGEFRQQYGVAASNWCAGCHSPLRLARGQLNTNIASIPQSNVDCMVCHSIQHIHQLIRNNGFDLAIRRPMGYEIGQAAALSDWLLLIQPAAHRARWNPSVTRRPEFCGACHSQILPSFLSNGQEGPVLQDTYREWQRSRYNSADPAVRRTCQDCHMPVASGLAADLGNHRPSHFFTGGSVDIAQITGAHALYIEERRLLASAATVSVMAGKCDQKGMELQVNVTNSGSGHNLPTGVTDLRQVWLEVTVINNADVTIYQSGRIDNDGFLDPSTVRFGVTLGDADGQPVYFHDIARTRYVLMDTTIPPGETREVVYTLPLTEPLIDFTELKVTAKLLYQTVPQNFINYYITPNLRFQSVTISSAFITLDVPSTCKK
jgi:hypothetical protein